MQTHEADRIKNLVMEYYRFNLGYYYVATECRNCDVLASDGRESAEIEVKISWADYLRDFAKRKYLEPPNTADWGANISFFAAPRALAARIAADVARRELPHGVFAVDSDGGLKIIRSPRPEHNQEVTQQALREIIKRMGAELIQLRNRTLPPEP